MSRASSRLRTSKHVQEAVKDGVEACDGHIEGAIETCEMLTDSGIGST